MSSSLERLKHSHDVTVRWRSFELRPPGAPPVPPEYRARVAAGAPRLAQIARQVYGIELNPVRLEGGSRLALIGAKVAEASGSGDGYHDAVFRAYWQEGLAIDDRAVLAGIAARAGLQSEPFLAALDQRAYLDAVLADIDLAHSYGLSGVPAIVFENQYLVSGAQPYETLARVTEQVRAETGAG